MIHHGDQVLIDERHQLFGGRFGLVEAIQHEAQKRDYLVSIEGTETLYAFRAEELLIP